LLRSVGPEPFFAKEAAISGAGGRHARHRRPH
jgi:hypothetical protein